MMIKKCPKGKIINPVSGRCVNKNSPVLKKQNVVNIVPSVPSVPSVSSKVLIKCGDNMYVNPKTKRCVQLKNKDIQKLLKQGYTLSVSPISVPIKKVEINDKKNLNDPGVKVLVPPQTQETVKLVYCGKGKVINPQTGRCILLSGPLGKKLTSLPYIIVNPPSTPQKTPLFIPQKELKEPKQKIPFPKNKQEKIQTALDTDGDNYVSIREYLDSVESKGSLEKSKGKNFSRYNQRDLGIVFILTLIKEFKGPIHHIGCIPLYHLCVYKDVDGLFYTMQNIRINKELTCHRSEDFYEGSKINTYASISILNAPLFNKKSNDIQVLTPPNLSELIKNCENDNKYMVVCDLTLLLTENYRETSHANVLIFDTKRKTIERFDPHGGNEYSKVKLAYDTDGNYKDNRKDFKFGDKKLKSEALFNQVVIDKVLSNKFKTILSNYTYYGTNDTTPYLGPQLKADDFGGLCVTWSCMYMLLRLLNPDLSPAEITIKMIDGTPEQLKNRILRFQKFIIRTLQKTTKNIKNEFD